ncbi:hypothetical protein [Massilia sp. YIM B04103]|uniref:hypothetical protein n=1 Tax=Massilia sp. YIM B04103 TaxID=2963106 RepID=UPI00210C6043|nr:hypothetical protein [Massilia sp. YIM B04103]
MTKLLPSITLLASLFCLPSLTAASTDKAEELLDCATPLDKSIELSSTLAFMHSAAQVSVAKASVAKSALSDANRQRLNEAGSSELLQQLVIEQFSHLQRSSHKYSFIRADGCALTKSYGNYRESVCLQPGAPQLGLETSGLPSSINADEMRKKATGWTLNMTCKGKNCAVYADQSQYKLKDAYLMIAGFDDEQAALLAVEGLNALANSCSSMR